MKFKETNEHFFYNKFSKEYVFYKEHGKNSVITIDVLCTASPTETFVMIGKQRFPATESLLTTFSSSYNKVKKTYTWSGKLNKVSRRVDSNMFRIGFQVCGEDITSQAIRVLSKQKKRALVCIGNDKPPEKKYRASIREGTTSSHIRTIFREELKRTLAPISTRLATLASKVNGLESKVNGLENKVKGLNARVKALEETCNENALNTLFSPFDEESYQK
jgi:hypothetical protein